MAGNTERRIDKTKYDRKNSQSIGESCPILNTASTALTGEIKGSEITQARTYIELPSASVKNGIITRANIESDTSPRTTEIVFARIYKKISKLQFSFKVK